MTTGKQHTAAVDEVSMPQVNHICSRCRVRWADVEKGRVVVSPFGNAHFGDGGITECGRDATGARWWWPS